MTEVSFSLPIALRKSLEESTPAVLRGLPQAVVERLLSANAHARCNAAYAECTAERVNPRNGYRTRA